MVLPGVYVLSEAAFDTDTVEAFPEFDGIVLTVADTVTSPAAISAAMTEVRITGRTV